MDNIKKVIESYELLLKELGDDGPTERWQLKRRMVNTMLRISIAEKDYHNMGAEHGVESPISFA